MTSSRVIKDYNLPDGGLYDLLVVTFPDGFPNSKLGFSVASTESNTMMEGVSRRVNGVQKVAQQFLQVLLSRKGSDPLNPTLGTYFPDLIRLGNIYSRGATESIVRQEVGDAEKQIQAYSYFKADPGERLASVELTRVDVGVNAVSIGLRIMTEAGESAAIYVPFPRLDLELN